MFHVKHRDYCLFPLPLRRMPPPRRPRVPIALSLHLIRAIAYSLRGFPCYRAPPSWHSVLPRSPFARFEYYRTPYRRTPSATCACRCLTPHCASLPSRAVALLYVIACHRAVPPAAIAYSCALLAAPRREHSALAFGRRCSSNALRRFHAQGAHSLAHPSVRLS
jgi:hypothetical protein